MPTDFTSYLNPFPTSTDEWWKTMPSPAGVPVGLDPLSNILFGNFFRKKDKKPGWIEKDGFMYHRSGSYAPVPISDIYGTSKIPTKAYKQTADNVRMLEDFLPFYAKAIAGQIIPQEQAKLAAAQATSPQFADLMASLYEQYGPRLNEIGNQIAKTNAFASAERDRDVLAGPGQDLIRQALETAKIYDPEFFATRELTSGRVADLLKSINLGSGLSETERREVEQGLAREGAQRGTLNAPSATEAVSNAMQYGEAGRNRELQNQSALAQAISASTQFLPASRSGVDVFQVATGKPSSANTGEGKFTGVTMPGQEAYQLAGGLFGNIGQNSSQQADIRATAKLNEKDWLDQFSQFTSGLSNIGGMLGGGLMCWVAREVYGVNNPRWIIFRQWMLNKAPRWLFNLYARYGQSFAWFIHDKPAIKSVIRTLMNNVINKHYAWTT